MSYCELFDITHHTDDEPWTSCNLSPVTFTILMVYLRRAPILSFLDFSKSIPVMQGPTGKGKSVKNRELTWMVYLLVKSHRFISEINQRKAANVSARKGHRSAMRVG